MPERRRDSHLLGATEQFRLNRQRRENPGKGQLLADAPRPSGPKPCGHPKMMRVLAVIDAARWNPIERNPVGSSSTDCRVAVRLTATQKRLINPHWAGRRRQEVPDSIAAGVRFAGRLSLPW